MSDYPVPPSFGSNYVADQTNSQYLPAYQNAYMQSDDGRRAQNHTAADYDSYAYNRALPVYGSANLVSGVPALPIYQGWNQNTIPMPSYVPQTSAPYNAYNFATQQSAQYHQPTSQPNHQQKIEKSKSFEVTGVSEGEFEDANSAAQTSHRYSTPQNRGDTKSSCFPPAQRVAQTQSHGYNSQQQSVNRNTLSGEQTQDSRHKSDSYSPPDIADREDQSETDGQKHLCTSTRDGSPQGLNHRSHNRHASEVLINNLQKNGYHSSQKIFEALPISTAVKAAPSREIAHSEKSIAEMRHKAKAAVLNLWPGGVRYQNYIEEGFKEDIVSKLFKELGLKPAAPDSSLLDTHQTAIKSKPAMNSQLKDTAGIIKQQSTVNDTLPLTLTNNGVIATAAALHAKPSQMAEKEKTLQSKMEALRKSREARATAKAVKPITTPAAAARLERPVSSKGNATAPTTSQLERPTSSKGSTSSPLQPVPVNVFGPSSINTTPPPAASPSASDKIQASAPVIPGLFLASNDSMPTPPSAVQISNYLRKRPVASDFDESAPAMAPFKRPFGYNRNEQPLVIDVSDDESDDVDMEVESQADQDSPVLLESKMSKSQNPEALNPVTRKPYTPPPNPVVHSTPTPPRTVPAGPSALQQKQLEIQLMKKKIAEAEARAKAKKPPSDGGTPTRQPEIKDSTKSINVLVNEIEDSAQKQQKADEEFILNQQRLIDAQAVEAENVAELKEKEVEEKRLRRRKIEADLPRVEAEVQEGQSKLEQLRVEIAKMEAGLKKNLDEKKRLADEMERLALETDETLQHQREKLDNLTKDEEIRNEEISPQPAVAPEYEEAEQRGTPNSNQSSPCRRQPSQSSLGDSDVMDAVIPCDIDERHNSSDISSKLKPANKDTNPNFSPDESDENLLADRVLQEALQEAVRAEADSHVVAEHLVTENSCALESHQLAPESTPSSMDEEKLSSNYSPNVASPDAPEADSDNYEPPDATLPDVDSDVNVDSPPFSPAPPDHMAEVDANKTLDIDTKQGLEAIAQSKSTSTLPLVHGSIPRVIEEAPVVCHKPKFFRPYESPLKIFRAYRFHPNFKREVAGGLRSLTYSHKIDPRTEFCRFELAGGVCNDPTCDSQHFKSIVLPDDGIMAALGCPDEFKGERRDQFIAGLREVLLGLRLRKIKDFDLIASEIVAHRAKFLSDESKILPLEGMII